MIKDGLLKKSSRQEGYYDLTEKGIKQANISQDVFTIFDLIERGLAEYKSGDVYLTDKGKSEGQAQYKEIDSILDFLHSLEDDKENSVYISTAIRWIVNRSITLPQDHEKAYQAFALARKKHLDL
jgi:predicted transcriptional regulator